MDLLNKHRINDKYVDKIEYVWEHLQVSLILFIQMICLLSLKEKEIIYCASIGLYIIHSPLAGVSSVFSGLPSAEASAFG